MVWSALHSEFSRRVQASLLFSAGVAALPVLFFVDPAQAAAFAPCPFRWATGWLCPGCGSLRAMHALLHGDFLRAVAFNPLMIVLLPLLALLLGRHFVSLLRDSAERPLPARVVWALLALTLLYTVARNLPFWPAVLAAA